MNGFMDWADAGYEWAEWGLGAAIGAGVSAALLAVVAIVINFTCRRWISARQMGWLWAFVLVRLLIPEAPASPCSLQCVLRSHLFLELTRSAPAERATADPNAAVIAPTIEASPIASPNATETGEPSLSILERAVRCLPWLWLAVAPVFLAWTVACQWRFSRAVKRDAVPAEPRLCRLWQECRERAGVRRNVRLVHFDGVRQPAVFGLFRPQLLLPSAIGQLNDEQLRMVMLHELAHVRRWHVAGNWLLVAIGAVQWWNPVYWLAAGRFRNLREQSCDAFALQWLAGRPAKEKEYGELLLSLAEKPCSAARWNVILPASILGFLSSFLKKRVIGNRIKALRSAGDHRGRWHSAAVALVIATLGVCGLTDAEQPPTPAATATEWMPRIQANWGASAGESPVDPGPNVNRVYDVEKALDRIAAVEKQNNEQTRAEVSFVIATLLRAGTGNYQAVSDQWARKHFHIASKTLSVIAPLPVQNEIAQNIRAWEQGGLAQICIETRLMTAETDLATTSGVSWQSLEALADSGLERAAPNAKNAPIARGRASVDEYLPVAVALLTEQQTKRLVNLAQSVTTANIMSAPKVTVFNGQHATISTQTQRPFVVGVQDGDASPHLTTALVDEGFKLSLRTVESADAKRIQLDGSLGLSQIGEVRTASAIVHGKPATIEIPRVKRRHIDVSAEIPDGHSLLVECIPTFEEKTYFYLLVTARNVTP